jgi:ketosteroid isomerase-like protein
MERKDFSPVTRRLGQEIADLRTGSAQKESQENLQSVLEQIDAIGRGDLDAALRNAHDDVRLEIFAPPQFPWIRRTVGAAALREAIQHNFATVVDQRPEVTSVTAQGDTVVLLGRERGRIKQTAAEYSLEFVQRFQFRGGRLAAVTIIAAQAE